MLCRVLSNKPAAPGMHDLRIEFSPEQAPVPGQFLHIAVPGAMLRRPISLCGFEDGTARLVYAVKGEGTRTLSRVTAGETLDVLGPLGSGFEPGNDSVLLVGGGIGLPPLLYFDKIHSGECHMVAGFRTKNLAILTDEFRSIDVCTDDGTLGRRGYPHEAARELILSGKRFDRVLACGPLPLLRAVAGMCKELGVLCFVSVEERMGCGVGACLVCACKVGGHYRRACADGPVFRGEDVDFDG